MLACGWKLEKRYDIFYEDHTLSAEQRKTKKKADTEQKKNHEKKTCDYVTIRA